MPPLQTPGIASMTSGTGSGGRFAPRYRFCIVTALGLCVGAAYMPPAKRYGRWAFTGCGVCILPCRAGVHARRTNQYFKFFNVRRAKSPALQSGVTGRASRKPRAGRTPSGPHAYGPQTLRMFGCLRFAGCVILPCRAGVHARRTDQYFKFFQCAAGEIARPTERRNRSGFPQPPRRADIRGGT